jgi:nicotinamide-nucleotide amidase
VGTVWLGWATPEQIVTELQMFTGDRTAVRLATVRHAMSKLLGMLV